MDRALGPADADYPEELFALTTPPVVYLRGRLIPRPRVAIVGSRRACPGALGLAERLGRKCGQAGVSVVSGGALGVDGMAHRGALSAAGATLVVLPTPLSAPSPRAHARLFSDVLRSGGGWLSERATGPTPRAAFASRNRLIAALADVVVVVQAGPRSGTVHTARAARKLDRRLLVLPWSLGDLRAATSFEILRAGAEVVTHLDDVVALARGISSAVHRAHHGPAGHPGSTVDLTPSDPKPPPAASCPPRRDPCALRLRADLLQALDAGAQPAEALAATLGWPVGRVLVVLSRLELECVVQARPGGAFVRSRD